MKLLLPLFFIIVSSHLTFSQKPHTAQVITTTGDLTWKLRLSQVPLNKQVSADIPLMIVYPKKKFQQILGFGGTYSEATSYNLKKLSPAKRQEVLSAIFHPTEGANWNFVRTTINSCDASSTYYSYDETPNDTTLADFSIQKDIDNYMIKGLQQALVLQPRLKLFASPWTPPVWMKSSGLFNEGSLKPAYYRTWALYFSKYLNAYQENNVPIWGVSPQNEPEAYKQALDACGWQKDDMNLFVSAYLAPLLQKNHPKVNLVAWDHNKNHLMDWCKVLLNKDKSPSPFTYIAHHWYEGGEGKYYEPLQEAHRTFPQFPLLAAEQGVFGLYLMQKDPAELYAKDIIGNMNNWSVAWIAWGMAFDHRGGPNHAGNFTHSPIMIDTEKEEIYYNPSYYYIAHFSKYVKPNAYRIDFQNNNKNIEMTAFRNPDGQLVIVLLNTNPEAQPYQLKLGNRILEGTLPAHAITTILHK